MALQAPSLIEPVGQLSPVATFKFKFGPASDLPTAWNLHVSIDQTFATITHWTSGDQTGGIAGNKVTATYAGAALVPGQIYYWRARGRIGGTIGPWSRTRLFSPDPTASSTPHDVWARAFLATAAYPRLTTLLGTLLPTGTQVATLLTMPYMGRLRVQDVDHPPPTDRIVELLGWGLHVDADAGWELAAVTYDVVETAP